MYGYKSNGETFKLELFYLEVMMLLIYCVIKRICIILSDHISNKIDKGFAFGFAKIFKIS